MANGAMRTLFDFSHAAAVAGWSAIDDRVMGGVSQSCLRHDAAGHAVFEGTVSLARNGGFASVRASATELQTPGAGRYLLDVRGDGRRYKLTLRIDAAFDGVSYQAEFAPVAGLWTRVDLPLSAFAPSFRGRSVPAAPPLDPGRVCQLGLMIAGGQAGDFALALRAISAAP